uniref:Uncharacterized protein n=1 Tax=Human herpesvirus 1 TaxID=10298 RepID=A0A2U9A4I2_HHV1|nr:hypothetical protein [Human alphaherpesvirus 1]
MCHTQGCVGGDFGQQPGRAQQRTLRVVHGGSGRLPVLTPPFIDLIAYVGVRPGPNPHVVQEGVRHFQGPRHAPPPTSRKRSTQRSPPVAPTSRKRSTQRSPPVASTRTFLLREGTNAGEPPSSAPASPLLRPRVPPPPPPRPPSSALLRPPKVLTRAKRRTGGFLSSEAPGVRPLCFVGGVGGSFRVSLSDAIPIPSRGVAMPTPSAPTALCESRSRSACSAAAPVVRGRRRLRASVAPGLYVRRRDPPPAARARPRGRRGVGHGASARTSP